MTATAAVRAAPTVSERPGSGGASGPRRHDRRRPSLAPVAARRPRLRRGRAVAVAAVVIAVGAPLAVAGAHAELTAGQVALTRLQQQLVQQENRQSQLEQRVASLEDPATIQREAAADGMVPATSIEDIPAVAVGPSAASGPSSGGRSSVPARRSSR